MNFQKRRALQQSNTSTREGRLFWKGARKVLVLLLMVQGFALASVPDAWAKEHVATIYFGGTSLRINDYIATKSPFKSPALVPLLYHHHDTTTPDRHYKKFVNGIGLPGTYKDKVVVAGEFMDIVMNKLEEGDTLTLNIIGNSRGGVLSIWFSSLVADEVHGESFNGRITKINIIALDPVPGDKLKAGSEHYKELGTTSGWGFYKLRDRITNYVGVYVTDERTGLFAPVVPSYDSAATRALILRIRAGHQTIVGSKQKGGHHVAFDWLIGKEYKDRYEDHDNLKKIGDISAIASLELLMSKQWGGAIFPDTFVDSFHTDPADHQTSFDSNVEFMNDNAALDKLYKLMRVTSYLPFTWESWRDNDCRNPITGITSPESNWHLPRCIIRINILDSELTEKGCKRIGDTGVAAAKCPLDTQSDIPLLGGGLSSSWAWSIINTMGNSFPLTDRDGDGKLNDEDNCPDTYNPGQENNDTDKLGDACDNCDFVANPTQQNNDLDEWGNACDNCQDKFSYNQFDSDGNGIGDICQSPHHFNCYKADTPKGSDFSINRLIGLTDQFEAGIYDLVKPERLCAPAIKLPASDPVELPFDLDGLHLQAYKIEASGQDCGECEGGVNTLTVEYLGADEVTFTIEGKVASKGPYTLPDPYSVPAGSLELELSGKVKKDRADRMGSNIRFIDTTSGLELASFHASCSRPFGIGTESENGLFVVIGGSSVKAGLLGTCEPPPPPLVLKKPWDTCNECDGGVSSARFTYNGPDDEVTVTTKGKSKKGEVVLYYSSFQFDGSDFLVEPLPGEEKLPKTIYLTSASGTVEMHTSCSKPFGPGLELGDFMVHRASSKNGGNDMCPVVRIENQFGTEFLTIKKPKQLLVPTIKDLSGPVLPSNRVILGTDHYKCYDVSSIGLKKGLVVNLEDQFAKRDFEIEQTKMLCNPVEKAHMLVTPIINDDGHLACYKIKPLGKGYCALIEPADSISYPLLNTNCKKDKECGEGLFCAKDVNMPAYLFNQFGDGIVDVKKASELCVPSTKSVGLH